jgi:site-specific recombinase XerD
VIANWAQATLPKGLTDTQLTFFLQSFDLTDPLGRRDYAIARCMTDLGLRCSEVVRLRLESFNWREGTITITGGKGRRTRQLPLPVLTGEAVARYLQHGRPTTRNRRLFVRHHAPVDKPIGRGAICSVICSAYARCGLDDRFAGTHALRHGHAMRLQRSGASLKEIADLLGHEDLDSTKIYAKVDLEGLRAVALPWPGRLQ